jgi:hypothetical protein
VYLPGYGSTPIEIDAAADGGRRGVQRDLLGSWEPPGESVQAFPNVDRYTVNVGSTPHAFALPARATATHLHADWLGALDPEWGGTLRGEYIRVERDAGGNEQLLGTIRSELPATLTDVQVFWIRNKRLPDRRYAMSGGVEARWVAATRSGQMLNLGKAISVGRLEPGGTLELSFGDTQEFSLERTIDSRYVEPFAGRSAPTVLRQNDYLNFMRMLGFYHQLTPPTYLKANPDAQDPESMLAVRMLGRELDLSPWFARPCIIVTGFLDNVPLPIPLQVDGETPRSDEGSRVVVRWIYPLPVDESIAFPIADGANPARR